MKTVMQKTREFASLHKDRKLSDKCPLKKSMQEYELIVAMTAPEPSDRPSAHMIKSDLLPKWQR